MRPAHRLRVMDLRSLACFVGGTIAGVGVPFLLLEGLSSPATATAEAPPQIAPAEVTAPPADWCAPGYEPLADGCLAAAGDGRVPRALVIYLHGRYARDAAGEEVDRQRRVAARATSRGFAVLALRGRLGGCSAAELSTWFCWPSNAQNAEGAGAVVESWAGALREARRRVNVQALFVLGFSNGGYFAALLATRGLLEADAFAIAHGGPVEPVSPERGKPPLLLLSADDDVAQDEMIRLDAALSREQWAHDSYARSGGHALTDQDIDAALTFFARSRERLPLDPPLPLHRAVHHPHAEDPADGAAEGGGEGPEEAPPEQESPGPYDDPPL